MINSKNSKPIFCKKAYKFIISILKFILKLVSLGKTKHNLLNLAMLAKFLYTKLLFWV